MKVLSLPLGADTGGVSNAIHKAFRDVAGWKFRAIISTLNYIEYPRDIEWSKHHVRYFWRWADVIHLHHNLSYLKRLQMWRLPPRPIVLHFHGTGFREDPERHLAEMRQHRALGLAATLDLWLLAPDELTWAPCPVNVDAMQRRRSGATRGVSGRSSGPASAGLAQGVGVRSVAVSQRHRVRPSESDKVSTASVDQTATDSVILIAHAPTNRQIKSTGALVAAVDRLKAEGHPIELDLIEGVSWDTCLERKAKADIYFDQVILGYGNNAIECWGMGIPVIAGAAPATLAEMERRFGSLPFYNATEATIYDALLALVISPDLRAEYAAKGLAHVRAWHDEAKVVAQLQDVYTRAAGSKVRAA